MGDSDEEGFLGPEFPGVPANWNFAKGEFENFKIGGRIRRQGVRFRVFEFDDQGTLLGEVTLGQRGVAGLDWTVHVANRKAAFFKFSGPDGEDGDFSRNGARNQDVTGELARTELDIEEPLLRTGNPSESLTAISTGSSQSTMAFAATRLAMWR